MKDRIILSWSGGKDSTLALYELLQAQTYEVAALLTTVTEDYDRISTHGVRRVLLEEQAELLGIPLDVVLISKSSSNVEYETKMRAALEKYRARGVNAVAFGDIFLEDLKQYRERNLAQLGMRGIFPIWKRDSSELAHSFINLGFQAITTCVDSQVLPREFVGREFDDEFLSDLPAGTDPCGENGEFHSFAFGGPIFKSRIGFTHGDIVLRDGRFYFCDLLPA
ncbi:MAG: diphthine--ammonia ligase [Chloroflexota bacterium]|nr:diphthine--ammonia ligase [Chloroflexota bacterium]